MSWRDTPSTTTDTAQQPAVWHGSRHAPVLAIRPFVRPRRGAWLLLAVGAGMLVAVVLICAVPLYSSLVANIQVHQIVAGQSSANVNLDVQVVSNSVTGGTAASVSKDVQRITRQDISGISSYVWSYTETNDSRMLPLKVNGQSPAKVASAFAPGPLGVPTLSPYTFDLAAALPHMRILSGKLPQDTAPGQPPQVMVTPASGLKAGDTILIEYGFGQTRVRVSGVWFPRDEHEPFWNGALFDTVFIPGPPSFPLLFTQAAFMSTFALPANLPQWEIPQEEIGMRQHFIFYTHTASIHTNTLADFANAIKNCRADLVNTISGYQPVQGVFLVTQLDTLVGQIQQQLGLLNLPLYIVVAQIAGLALFFVVAMAAIYVESHSGEIATLKSRGASTTQLLGGYTAQGLLLAALAAVAGPFVAVGLSLLLIPFFVPSLGNNLGAIASTVSPALVAQPAVAVAALGAAALSFAAWQAARLDVLAFRREQARGGRKPFWRRYYLDLLLVVLCAAGYLELSLFGGLGARVQVGATAPTGPDPLLLATPALLLLAGALLVLRLFPLAARLGASLAAHGRGATGMLAFAQVSRAVAQFSRLTLLLTLSVGLGVFALTFQSSLAHNAADQAAYVAGGDARIVMKNPAAAGTPFTGPFQAVFAKLPGVEDVTPIYRSGISVTTNQSDYFADLMGIDPANFGSVASWRSDYASQPLQTLMAGMRAHRQGKNAGDRQHPLWALVSVTFASRLNLHAGDRFSMTPNETPEGGAFCVVGAIVSYFPTLYNDTSTGFIVVDEPDYFATLSNPNVQKGNYVALTGPTEFWLRTNGAAADNIARAHLLQNPDLFVQSVIDRRALTAQLLANPLTAGMAGLLLLGAAVAALLALLGSLIQSGVAARQRLTQFAILRTLGTSGGQLVRLLVNQQLIVYLFGLVGGLALGAILATATLPFLQFSSSLADPATVGVPPYILVFQPVALLLFGAALALAFLVALALSALLAARVSLGASLRLGED